MLEWMLSFDNLFVFHLIFSAFLVYTGIKTVSCDEEDEDPSQQPLVLWLQSNMKFVSVYAKDASFFVRVPVNDNGEAEIPEEAIERREASETDPLNEEEGDKIPVVDFSLVRSSKTEVRATMLF